MHWNKVELDNAANFRSARVGLLNEYNRERRAIDAETDRAALVAECVRGVANMVAGSTVFAEYRIDIQQTAEVLAAAIFAQGRR